MTPDELESLTYRHLSLDFVRRATQAVFMAHEVAWEESLSTFANTEAENLRPFIRRAKLEAYLRDAAEIVRGVDASVVRTPKRNWWWHTEITAGPVILTQSAVDSPAALVRRAEFRLTLARNNQLSLFGDNLDQDSPLYVLLLHSRSVWPSVERTRVYGHLPGSAHLAFPSHDLTRYLHRVNLFDLFPDVVDANLPNAWDEQARISYLWHARERSTG